jgi:hypothetical protein
MSPADFYTTVLEPAAVLLPHDLDTPEARLLLFAIAGQESSWTNRLQTPIAYARGFWQCEHGGAVMTVLSNPTVGPVLTRICALHEVASDSATIFDAIAYHDPLAYALARLVLRPDPVPLPAIGLVEAGWEYYVRTWRPGTPRPARWAEVYAAALAVFPVKQ